MDPTAAASITPPPSAPLIPTGSPLATPSLAAALSPQAPLSPKSAENRSANQVAFGKKFLDGLKLFGTLSLLAGKGILATIVAVPLLALTPIAFVYLGLTLLLGDSQTSSDTMEMGGPVAAFMLPLLPFVAVYENIKEAFPKKTP